MYNLYIPFCSLILSFILLIIYFIKINKVITKENIYYFGMIVDSFIATCFCILSIYLIYIGKSDSYIVEISNKLECFVIINFAYNLFLYIYSCCNYHNFLTDKKWMFNIIFLLLSIMMPSNLDINNTMNYMVVVGPLIYFTNIIVTIFIFFIIYVVIKKYKLLQAKIISVIFIIGFMITIAVIRKIIPEFICMEFLLSLSTLIMYFTIENPDIKLLEEVRKAKDKADDLNEDKTDFIFNITSGMKENLNDIDNNIDIISNSKDIEEIKSNVNNIKNIVNSSKILLYKNLNITEQDIKDIELMNNKYNIRNLVKQILYFDKGNKRETLDLRVNIEKSVPDYLYGDSIKLKQILTTILDNSIRHTDKGFIELNINCIKKYEVCRLLITLEDSGRGMSNEMIDDILSKDNLNRKYISRNLDLKSVNKIINLIGGTFSISSKLSVGTKIEITIDQKIVNNNEKKIDNYVDNIKKKKILLVDENIEEIDKTKKILEKYNYYVDTVIWGEQCLNKVRNGERFDLIIMDYDMPKLNGIEVYNRLKKVNNFKIPVVMITDSIDDKVRDKYKDLGIYEVIAKPLTKDKIDDLIKEINK